MAQLYLRIVLAALSLCTTTSAATVSLLSPREFEVFQRDSSNLANVLLRGRCTNAEYRVDEGAWQAPASDKVGQFEATVRLKPGWHVVEVRTVGHVEVTKVDHVGVGEVFVIAGQSNSTNYGSEKQKPTSGMVSTFDGSAWRIADDPQPGVQDHSTGGSFIPAFGDALAVKLHMPIGVASVGAGATSVREWLPRGSRMTKQPTTGHHVTSVGEHEWECDGKLYSGLVDRLKQLGPNGCRAILWHQGESDAGQARAGYPADRQISGAEYHDRMKQLIAQSQKDIGWEVPWIVAQATYHSEKDPSDQEFRAAQKSLWTEHVAFEGPDTDQLRVEFRAGVHMNPKGLMRHGQLWAEWVEKDLLLKQ